MMRYSRKKRLRKIQYLLRRAVKQKCLSENCGAWVDIIGVVLPLIGAWLLFIVGVPDLIESALTTETGDVIADQKGNSIVAELDPHTMALICRYYWYAIPAMALTTAGAIIQMRRPWAVIRSKTGQHTKAQ